MLLHDPGADVLGADVTHIIRALRHRSEPTVTAAVSTAAGVSAPRTRAALNDMVSIGVLTLTKVGRANAYSINRTHVAWDGIQLLLDARSLVLRQLGKSCEAVAPPDLSIALCIPAAHSSGPNRSAQFVVLIPEHSTVGSETIAHISTVLRDKVGSLTGNAVSISVIQETELRQRIAENDAVAKEEWFRSTAVHGPDLSQLILELTRESAQSEDAAGRE